MIDYFYNETELSSGFIADLWRFNASTGLGLFTGNSGGNLVSRTVSGNNFDDFSLYFTYKKQQSAFNSGSIALFSNYSGGGGFTFGLDSCNYPFIKAGKEGFTFDQFDLGGKNVLCLQKAGNSFSLSRYDVPSSGILNSQNYFFSPQIQLSGGGYKFGGSLDSISGLNNFYGTVEQLLFLNEKVSDSDSLTIFSGFSNLSITKDVFGSYEVESQEWFVPNSGFTTGLQALFQDYFTGKYQDYVVDEGLSLNQEYIGRISYSGTPVFTTRNYYDLGGIGFCQSGASIQMGDPDEMAWATGLPAIFEVDVNFSIGPANTLISAFQADEMYFSYDLSEIYPGLRYSNLYKLKIGEDVVQSSNTGYYSGFEMKGIFTPGAALSILGSFNSSFSNVGNEAVFDSVSGVFRAGNANTGLPIYLNGELETGILIQSGIIDILNYEETSADEIIFDTVSGPNLLSMSFGSSSLGDYYAGTAFAASGLVSFDLMYRLRNSEFYETHPYHLFHGKNWQETNAESIYNSTGNWI